MNSSLLRETAMSFLAGMLFVVPAKAANFVVEWDNQGAGQFPQALGPDYVQNIGANVGENGNVTAGQTDPRFIGSHGNSFFSIGNGSIDINTIGGDINQDGSLIGTGDDGIMTTVSVTSDGTRGTGDNGATTNDDGSGDAITPSLRLLGRSVENWGGGAENGGISDTGPGYLVFFSRGAPIRQDDGTQNHISLTFDFSDYTDGGVQNLEFVVAGVDRQFNSTGNNEVSDIVGIEAKDASGNVIDLSTSGFITTSNSATFETTSTATNGLLFDSRNSVTQANGSDHLNGNTNIGFDSGNSLISEITIIYRADTGDVRSSRPQDSTGVALSSFSFETVPEPSAFMFSFVGLAGLMLHRKRD